MIYLPKSLFVFQSILARQQSSTASPLHDFVSSVSQRVKTSLNACSFQALCRQMQQPVLVLCYTLDLSELAASWSLLYLTFLWLMEDSYIGAGFVYLCADCMPLHLKLHTIDFSLRLVVSSSKFVSSWAHWAISYLSFEPELLFVFWLMENHPSLLGLIRFVASSSISMAIWCH